MEDFMNKPDTSGYQAVIKSDGVYKWVTCPFCGKRQFPVTPGAVIQGQLFKCKGSSCKRTFEVNIRFT